MAVVLPVFLVVAFIISLAAVDGGNPQTISFEIKRGEGFKDVAAHLREGGLIKSETWFKIYSLVTGSAHLFKPGTYQLSSGMTVPKIIEIIIAGPHDISITIKEGETLVDIDRKLAAAKLIGVGALIDFNKQRERSLEGFLFS